MDYFPTEEEQFELMHSDDFELLREQDNLFNDKVQSTNINTTKSNVELNISELPAENPTNRNNFPTEDEEFDLMHGDDWELLKEQDIGERVAKSRKSLNFDGLTQNEQIQISASKNTDERNEFTPLPERNSVQNNEMPENNPNKRTIQELFGDIDDLLAEGIGSYESVPKKRKKGDKNNADLALIEHILTLRKLCSERDNSASNFGKDYTTARNNKSENVSYDIPKYPFIAMNNHNGDRIYMRFHSEEYEKEEIKRIVNVGNFAGVMGRVFKDIWIEATKYINTSLNVNDVEVEDVNSDIGNSGSLWVDLYKPRKYFELLSDESTNRILLRWLKLWDKIVFNIRPKLKPMKINEKQVNQKFKKQELYLELDEHGRPKYKVALLCGPPGLGKTTLAHMVAKQAGYNVVEINASDERNLEQFERALENATSMRSVIDQEKRPNCLVFDEIDGAPATSVDFLIKFISENHVTVAKKGKHRTKHILKRPIICICNDVYAPALRGLRQIAFVVNFPQTSSTRLAERLSEISKKESIKTDMGALLALAQKSRNDIRSCLSFLHFYKSQEKPVTLSDVMKTDVGEKDVQKGLFAVWGDIFQIERTARKEANGKHAIDTTLKTRMVKILQTVNSFGDHDRVMQGIFENYPKMNVKDSSLVGTCEALDWFCFSDTLNKYILSKQDYTLATYLSYGFVMWHFVFATMNWQKINYPSKNYEVRFKRTQYQSIAKEMIRGMRPSVRVYLNPSSLKMDISPLLNQIIVPYLRPVNLHLYTQQEKNQLNEVVNIMIDYNLNYVQERSTEGIYVYNLDPNLEKLASFPGSKPKRTLTYANRQLVSREIELEKMRIKENHKFKDGEKTLQKKKEQKPMRKLQAKKMKTSDVIVTKDFFGQEVRKIVPSGSGPSYAKHDIFYLFKEGYTNAVRKKLTIKQLK